MFTLRTTIQYVRSPEYHARQLDDGARAANTAAVESWHQRFLPLHFTEGAFARYNYQKRSGQGEPAFIYTQKPIGSELQGGNLARRLIRNRKYWWRKKNSG